MKKIEAIIKPYVLEDVKAGLQEIGLMGMTVSEVRGYTGGARGSSGKAKAHRNGHNHNGNHASAEVIQGGAVLYSESGAMTFEVGISTYGFAPQDDFVPSLKVELVVAEAMVDEAVKVIVESGHLHSFAAGELVVYSILDVIRIRTEEHLEQAI